MVQREVMSYDLIGPEGRRRKAHNTDNTFEADVIRRQKEIDMKGNSKKLGVFVTVITIAFFSAVAMGSADDQKWKKAIEAEYGVTSSGNCICSTGGFNANYTPIGTSWSSASMSSGTFTFRHNGTGTAEAVAFGLTLSPSPSANSQKFKFDFVYEVSDEGQITAHMVGPYNATMITGTMAGSTVTTDTMNLFGYVSPDHKTITLGSANEVQKYTVTSSSGSQTLIYMICNFSRVLIRVDH